MSGTPIVAKWRLVPALTLAGFVSALFTASIWWPSTAAGDSSGVLWAVLGSMSFGLAVGSVVWFYSLLENWKILACLIAVTVTAHLLERYAEAHSGTALREYVDISLASNIEPLVALTSFGVASVLYLAWIFLTSPRCKIAWGIVIAFECSLLASVTVTVIHGTQRGAWISFFTGRPLELVWQTVLATFLGIALALKRREPSVFASKETEKPRRSFKTRLVVAFVLVGYFVAVGMWSTSVEKRDAARRAQLMNSIKSEAATKLASAPSLHNLPPLRVHAFDEVLVWDNIGEWTPSGLPGAYVSPELRSNLPTPGVGAQVVPERKTYYLSYSKKGSFPGVRADVTAYPNEEWAHYQAEIPPITRQARGIEVLQRFGNNVYQEGPYFSWSSGDFVVHLDCQGIKPEVIDEFLKAYLAKLPSNL